MSFNIQRFANGIPEERKIVRPSEEIECTTEHITRSSDEELEDLLEEIDCDGRCLNCENFGTSDCPDNQ